MRPVLWVPGLYTRLVELPAGTNTSPAEAAVSYGVPVDIPAHGRCRPGSLGLVVLDLDSIPGTPDGRARGHSNQRTWGIS